MGKLNIIFLKGLILGHKILNGAKRIEIKKGIVHEVKMSVQYMSFSAHADAKGEYYMYSVYSVQKNQPLRIFRTDWKKITKLFFNSKISCVSTSFKKEISIFSHIAKKLQACQYLQNCL